MLQQVGFLLGLVLAVHVVPAGAQSAQSTIVGKWQGALSVGGVDLGITVTFDQGPVGLGAAIDIPQQGATGLSLKAVKIEGDKVHFELPAGPGLAVFDGTLSGDAITGTFVQGVAKGTFSLKRGDTEPARAATPSEPLPYLEEEATLTNGAITLGGTLSRPKGTGPYPAVILLTGSGAQDRDEDVAGFKVFKVLADHLVRQGIAVLRADDRGVGRSTGSLVTSTESDLAGDALAGVAFLKTRPGIDPKRIGLLGHSEGGLVAPLAASRSGDVSFVVMMAGPGVTGERLMLAQNELVGRSEGRTDEQIRQNGEMQRRIFAAVRAGDNAEAWDALRADMRRQILGELEKLPADQRKTIPDLDAYANRVIDRQLAGFRTPWFKNMLDLDPATALSAVRCPVLAMFGERDLQVPPSLNRDAVDAALGRGGNRDFAVVIIPAANHLFQATTTGKVSEYGTLPRAFAPAFLDQLDAWLRAHLGLR